MINPRPATIASATPGSEASARQGRIGSKDLSSRHRRRLGALRPAMAGPIGLGSRLMYSATSARKIQLRRKMMIRIQPCCRFLPMVAWVFAQLLGEGRRYEHTRSSGNAGGSGAKETGAADVTAVSKSGKMVQITLREFQRRGVFPRSA